MIMVREVSKHIELLMVVGNLIYDCYYCRMVKYSHYTSNAEKAFRFTSR